MLIRMALAAVFLYLTLVHSNLHAEAIHDAVRDGDASTVQTLVDRDREQLNVQDENGKSPLHTAIERSRTDIAEYLIEQGARVDLTDSDGELPLHYAAVTGNLEMGRLLLERARHSVNDSSTAKHGGFVGNWTPLHLACLNGHPEFVRLLLDFDAVIEVTDGVKRTPLILSAEGSDMDVVRILADNGANINATALRGYTALLWAARNGFQEMVEYLLDQGATIESDMLWKAFELAVLKGMERLYEVTLEQGYDVAEVAQSDPDFICPAVAGGSARIVASLVENGFSLDWTDKDGWTPMHHAASEGRVDVIEYMLSRNVAIDERTQKGETAYNLATALRHQRTADLLAANGADTCAPQYPVLEGPYMGQLPPEDVPLMFMPGIVSGHYRAHSSIAFSPDGKEAYWTEMVEPEGAVKLSRMEENRWSYPVAAGLDRDPSFSPDGNCLFFIRTRPFRPGEKPGGDPDVKEEYWYLERTNSGWSEPVSVGDAVNRLGVHWPCSIDKDRNLYFSEFKQNMYFSAYVDGEYQEPVKLAEHFENPTLVGHSPFIAPETDYLLYATDHGLCISFRTDTGTWTDGINLGDEINGSHVNTSPHVSHDGKYMFFVSAGRDRPWGIYWISTRFVDRLRAEHLPTE
jgi:ankyrin repeat protein